MRSSENYIAIPPGATIKEQLEYKKMTQKEFAQRMGMSEKHISNLINGKVELTTDMATKLEFVLGLPAHFWQKLEASFRTQLQKVREEQQMENEINFVSKAPYNDMAKLGWVEKTRKVIEKVYQLRKFFEVANLGNIENLDMRQLSFRVKGEANQYAWMALAHKAKVEARAIETKPINTRKLINRLGEIRGLTTSTSSNVEDALRCILSECGIALVVLPHLNKSFFQGVSFVDGNRIVLGLSVRGRSADIFWFTLFHELYHIIEEHIHSKNARTNEEEVAADKFAQDTLIPQELYQRFIEKGDYKRQAILDYSQEIGIAPGILLGRLQKDGIVGYELFQDLKVNFLTNGTM